MLNPIKTEDQYNLALARVYELMHAEIKENSDEFDELEVVSILIKEYEVKHYPVSSLNL